MLGNFVSVIDVEIQELNIYHSHVFFYGRAAFKKEPKFWKPSVRVEKQSRKHINLLLLKSESFFLRQSVGTRFSHVFRLLNWLKWNVCLFGYLFVETGNLINRMLIFGRFMKTVIATIYFIKLAKNKSTFV